jgi:hypothetical protein
MPDSSPGKGHVFWPYVAVFAAMIVAWRIYVGTDPAPLSIDAAGFSIFAPFYIAAQAIERLLEPAASRWNNTTVEKAALKSAKTEKSRIESLPEGDARRDLPQLEAVDSNIAIAELALAKAKSERAIPLWAAASVLGLLVCSMLGLGLIEAVSNAPSGSEFVRTVDVLLTGLAVGAGTKPLHDLISRLEKAKDNADPAT